MIGHLCWAGFAAVAFGMGAMLDRDDAAGAQAPEPVVVKKPSTPLPDDDDRLAVERWELAGGKDDSAQLLRHEQMGHVDGVGEGQQKVGGEDLALGEVARFPYVGHGEDALADGKLRTAAVDDHADAFVTGVAWR